MARGHLRRCGGASLGLRCVLRLSRYRLIATAVRTSAIGALDSDSSEAARADPAAGCLEQSFDIFRVGADGSDR